MQQINIIQDGVDCTKKNVDYCSTTNLIKKVKKFLWFSPTKRKQNIFIVCQQVFLLKISIKRFLIS